MSGHTPEAERLARDLHAALPAAPWPSRWIVEPGAGFREFVIAHSGSPRLEVRIDLVAPGPLRVPPPQEGAEVVIVGRLSSVGWTRREVAEARYTAFRLALSYLVMES